MDFGTAFKIGVGFALGCGVAVLVVGAIFTALERVFPREKLSEDERFKRLMLSEDERFKRLMRNHETVEARLAEYVANTAVMAQAAKKWMDTMDRKEG